MGSPLGMGSIIAATGGPERLTSHQANDGDRPGYTFKGVFDQARVRPADAPGASFVARPIFPDVRGAGRYYDPQGTLSGTVGRPGIATIPLSIQRDWDHFQGNA
jgi:hypothetical protein